MQNNLFPKLKKAGFQGEDSVLNLKIRNNYYVVVDFLDVDEIIISNHYYNEENKHDYPKKFVIFSGNCGVLVDFEILIRILNVEEDAREKILQNIAE